MKTIIIVLLIVAAAAGTFYFLQTKKSQHSDKINSIAGTWRLDNVSPASTDSSHRAMSTLLVAMDSNVHNYKYELQSNGLLLLHTDSLTIDTSWYEVRNDKAVLFKDNNTDSTGELLAINLLNQDSMILQAEDSARFHFSKLK